MKASRRATPIASTLCENSADIRLANSAVTPQALGRYLLCYLRNIFPYLTNTCRVLIEIFVVYVNLNLLSTPPPFGL